MAVEADIPVVVVEGTALLLGLQQKAVMGSFFIW
jgi:hypothetical protein